MTVVTEVKSADQLAFESVQVGDVFVSSWGYDQTNIDYYEVVAKTKAMVKIIRIQSKVVADNGPQVQVVPNKGVPHQWPHEVREGVPVKVMNKRVRAGWQGKPRISIESWRGASLYEGGTYSATGSGWGH